MDVTSKAIDEKSASHDTTPVVASKQAPQQICESQNTKPVVASHQEPQQVSVEVFKQLIHRMFKDLMGMETMHCVLDGNKSADYLRGADIPTWMWENETFVCELLPGIFSAEDFANPNALASTTVTVMELLMNASLVQKCGRIINSDGGRLLKWPKNLLTENDTEFELDKFYTCRVEFFDDQHLTLMLCGLAVVIIIFLFPAWPYYPRRAAYFAVFHVFWGWLGLQIIRPILAFLAYVFGYSFWLFPNLNDEDMTLAQTFNPVYEFKPLINATLTFRLAGSGILLNIMAYIWFGIDDSIGSISIHAYSSMYDYFWEKVSAPPQFNNLLASDTMYQRLADGKNNDIQQLAAEGVAKYTCLQKCNFENDEVVEKDCLGDCECATLLMSSPCLSLCHPLLIKYMKEQTVAVCTQPQTKQAEGDDEEDEVIVLKRRTEDDDIVYM